MSLALIAIFSCTNEIVTMGQADPVYPSYYSSKRVKTISGENDIWGKFEYHMNYDEDTNLLTSSYRTDEDQDTVGYITFTSYSDVSFMFSVYDVVINIHQDSISAIDDSLKTTIGQGKYTLKDSIYKYHSNSELRFSATTYIYTDRRPYKSVLKYYEPEEMASDAIEDFTSDYVNTFVLTENYEYNLDGRVIVNRRFDEHINDPADADDNEIFAYKEEAVYDDDKLVYLTISDLTAGESFSAFQELDYTYSGDNISSITGGGYSRTFTYSGNTTTYVDNGETYTYTTNDDGLVTRIVYPNGNYMDFTYEDGTGMIEWLVPQFDKFVFTPFTR